MYTGYEQIIILRDREGLVASLKFTILIREFRVISIPSSFCIYSTSSTRLWDTQHLSKPAVDGQQNLRRNNCFLLLFCIFSTCPFKKCSCKKKFKVLTFLLARWNKIYLALLISTGLRIDPMTGKWRHKGAYNWQINPVFFNSGMNSKLPYCHWSFE